MENAFPLDLRSECKVAPPTFKVIFETLEHTAHLIIYIAFVVK